MIRYRLFILNAVLVLVLVGSQMGRQIEAAALTKPGLLKSLDLSIPGLKSIDVAIPQSELELLEPDAWLVKRYVYDIGANPIERKPRCAELAVIAGHRKKTVHTPAFCMTGDGWEMVERKDFDVRLPDRTIPATRMTMAKGPEKTMTTFFFTDGDFSTRSLIKFQGVQILKRFRSEIPVGALIRVIVPIYPKDKDAAYASRVSDEFSRLLIPKVMGALREAKLK
jgi:EpsI family protein